MGFTARSVYRVGDTNLVCLPLGRCTHFEVKLLSFEGFQLRCCSTGTGPALGVPPFLSPRPQSNLASQEQHLATCVCLCAGAAYFQLHSALPVDWSSVRLAPFR